MMSTGLLAMGLLAVSLVSAESPPYDATDRYQPREIEGWTVLISDRFADEEPELLDNVLGELRRQLRAIRDVVPAPAVEKLRQIQIWVEVHHTKFPCMCYHVSEDWLRANGVNPEKTGHVELANARNFLSWTRQQPWMVLHELAHGYHDRFIERGYRNASIRRALTQAREAGLYEEVQHISGRMRRHYAATNPMEYFAEGTEAYFGKNDFFPFDREELREYDPGLYRLLEELWEVKAADEPLGNTTKNAEEAEEAGVEVETRPQ